MTFMCLPHTWLTSLTNGGEMFDSISFDDYFHYNM